MDQAISAGERQESTASLDCGHWRHQLYGKQLVQIQLKWIRPALVCGEDQPTQGYVYDLPSPTGESCLLVKVRILLQ